jgi:hypothetical protein
VSPSEGRQPAEPDGEDQDQQDADQEGGQRDADQAEGQEEARQPGIAIQAGIDPHRHADQQREGRGAEGEFQRRRRALPDQFRDRAGQAVGQAEFPLHRIGHEGGELHPEGLVEAKVAHQRVALRLGEVLPQHDRHRIADIGEHREGDQRHGQHDRDRLEQSADDEGEHAVALRGGRGRRGPRPRSGQFTRAQRK